MSTNNLEKFKKGIAIEKASVAKKIYSIDNKSLDKFSKASEFLDGDEKNIIKAKVNLVRNSFLLPEDEFLVINKTMKILIDKGYITKPTDIFRIALSILNNADNDLIVSTYEKLNKISRGKPKKI